MKQFEYQIVQCSDSVFSAMLLNNHGRDGWELVAARADGISEFLYFKREKIECAHSKPDYLGACTYRCKECGSIGRAVARDAEMSIREIVWSRS